MMVIILNLKKVTLMMEVLLVDFFRYIKYFLFAIKMYTVFTYVIIQK